MVSPPGAFDRRRIAYRKRKRKRKGVRSARVDATRGVAAQAVPP
jgi:hypothetical protein